jgi:hypothetical protein
MLFITRKFLSRHLAMVSRSLAVSRVAVSRVASLVALAGIGLSTQVQAGEITSITWFSGVASVAGDFIGPLDDPNNDDVAGDSLNELLVTQKAYFAVGPVDLEFTVAPTGGTTEYTIREGVDNGTGIPWSSYRIELGFGVGALFTPSPAGDGLDFDALDFNSPPDFSGSGFFTSVSWGEDVLVASGGIFPVGGFPSPLYRFNIDVPDGISSFTIRQQPIAVPEPTSALLVLGLFGLLPRLRRTC